MPKDTVTCALKERTPKRPLDICETAAQPNRFQYAALSPFYTKKERRTSLFLLLSCLKAIAAGAVFAVASVADVDLIEFAVHTVGIVTAFAHAARYAAVDFTLHDRPSFPIFDLC